MEVQNGFVRRSVRGPARAAEIVGCESNRKLALQAARETITLLKNENHLVPLNPRKIKSIAVIGPNADRELFGGYSGKPRFFVSVLEGIRLKVGDRVQVPYAEGCKITVGGSWSQDLVTPRDPEEDRKQIQEAFKVARQADVIVWPSAAMSRLPAKPGRSSTWGTAPGWKWSASNRSWSRRCFRLANR